MPKNQYNSPAMEVVEFGKEDAVCTMSWGVYDSNGNPTGNPNDSGTVITPGSGGSGGYDPWDPDNW